MKYRIITFGLIIIAAMLAACTSSPSGEITIYYGDGSQFELIDTQGNRVLIDVSNPKFLSTPATDTDILLTTHGHPDHLNPSFISEFPGEQLFIREGEINAPGISIAGIASAHTASEQEDFSPENGSNYIFIIDMGGLRIAHFGDIGQDELTPEQLEALGEVDIALTQFVNSYSQMNMTNKKGFNLMDQLKPKLIIPTHGNSNMDAMGYANELWDTYNHPQNNLIIKKSDLDEATKFIILGAAANSMKAIFDLPDWAFDE